MTSIVPVRRYGDEEFQVEIEVVAPSLPPVKDPELAQKILEVAGRRDACLEQIEALSAEIEKLTSRADGLDYTIAAVSGVLCGLLDSFFVGDYNPDLKEIVTQFAAKKGGKTFDSYEDAQAWLAKEYHPGHDAAYRQDPVINKGSTAPNGHTHRLDDLAHHPTLLGLAASIFFQFFRVALFVNKEGKLRPVFVKPTAEELAKVWIPAVLSGLLIWLGNMAMDYAEGQLDRELPEPLKKLIRLIAATPAILQVLKCAEQWFGHIMSDVGPKSDGTDGKGIPGIFLSLLKELAMVIPSPALHTAIQALYNSGVMNFDKELEVLARLQKQAIPVLINETLVRGFYFVRRLITEYKKTGSLLDMNWEEVIPFGNRTVERMMTVASGTFTAVDVADMAIRSGGFNPGCLVRLNFAGVGRFAIAVGTDIAMGIRRSCLRDERMAVCSEMLLLSSAKIYYLEADMWQKAKDTGEELARSMAVAEKSVAYFAESWEQLQQDVARIRAMIAQRRKTDGDFWDDVADALTDG